MNAERNVRRSVGIRRRGRHTTPSQVEKVAEKAGKAAPAMAIAGALVATPHAQHAAAAATQSKATATATAAATVVAAHKAAAGKITLDSVTARAAGTSYYKVQPGDTLSRIANRFYGNASDWQWLYHENDTTVSDPNLIYPGQTLRVPANPPANFTLNNYTPRHAKSAASAPVASSTSDGDSGSSTTTTSSGGFTSLGGTLGCSGLEQLWIDAGGARSAAFMAAEIAMAESGGDQYALSPTNDYGYWQINASNGSLATFNAYGNARAAIALSNDGTNWSAWTTYTSGAYSGRC